MCGRDGRLDPQKTKTAEAQMRQWRDEGLGQITVSLPLGKKAD